MITESGKVVAEAGNKVWVQTIRQSACTSCAARHGCGQKALASFTAGRANRVLVDNTLGVRVGDEVTVAISESALLAASGLVYALPLLLFVAGALAGHWLSGGAEPAAVAGAVIGMAVGFGFARSRRVGADARYAPRLIRTGTAERDTCL
ncbi:MULTISPECIES: SoxR reducing system RseC family protein [Marinobacter]|uniref:Sigma E positive regulator RseC/MucC n=1 Tax=Marinobacter profundi TaxID=2666256 RepID=A0A2G1UKB6_9GAMM|nr:MULTISPECIES: SoxR reducing system RseC family protein [Marinobacter]MBD3657320.1 SoxR reducing system RseC family protein [Marinobacter sp.]PHQ14885.1 sigma E positive regulator RseC/MucC [Marinobacter profundi]